MPMILCMQTPTLFDPIQVGAWTLPNRVVMAPLTRNRAPGQVPTPLMATYYAQRAQRDQGAGLIITDATTGAGLEGRDRSGAP